MSLGKRTWVFADGDLPPQPPGVGEPLAHEALMIVNSGKIAASIKVTLLFEDSEPLTGLSLEVPGQRVRCFRLDQPIWGNDYRIPPGQYALVVESSQPVVAVFGRLDRRSDVAYYTVPPYAE